MPKVHYNFFSRNHLRFLRMYDHFAVFDENDNNNNIEESFFSY